MVCKLVALCEQRYEVLHHWFLRQFSSADVSAVDLVFSCFHPLALWKGFDIC